MTRYVPSMASKERNTQLCVSIVPTPSHQQCVLVVGWYRPSADRHSWIVLTLYPVLGHSIALLDLEGLVSSHRFYSRALPCALVRLLRLVGESIRELFPD